MTIDFSVRDRAATHSTWLAPTSSRPEHSPGFFCHDDGALHERIAYIAGHLATKSSRRCHCAARQTTITLERFSATHFSPQMPIPLGYPSDKFNSRLEASVQLSSINWKEQLQSPLIHFICDQRQQTTHKSAPLAVRWRRRGEGWKVYNPY